MGHFWGNLGVNLKIEIEKKESGCREPDTGYQILVPVNHSVSKSPRPLSTLIEEGAPTHRPGPLPDGGWKR